MELRSVFLSITAITFVSIGFGLSLVYPPEFDVSINSVATQNKDINSHAFHLNKVQA